MNCKIVGYEYKTLEVVLSPGESFYAERGSIVYVDEALQREAEWNGSGAGNGLGNLIAGINLAAIICHSPSRRNESAAIAPRLDDVLALGIGRS